MGKLVANTNMILIPDDPNVVCTITKVGPAGTKLKCDGQFAALDGYQVSVSAITYPSAGATVPDPGPYVVPLNATATKMKSENKFVLRVDDLSDTINATPEIPSPPPPGNTTPYPISFKIKISVAGNTKVKAE
jgi:hypothetical protein